MRHASHSGLPTSGSYALLNMRWKWHTSGNPEATPSRNRLLGCIQWGCCKWLIEEGRLQDSQKRTLWHLMHLAFVAPVYSKGTYIWELFTPIAKRRHRITWSSTGTQKYPCILRWSEASNSIYKGRKYKRIWYFTLGTHKPGGCMSDHILHSLAGCFLFRRTEVINRTQSVFLSLYGNRDVPVGYSVDLHEG